VPDLATLREPAGRLLDGALGDACAGWQDQTVARPDGESGEANVHAAWRLALAGRADASSEKLAALTVAGSVGTGLAGRFSDLELDCYWFDPPSDLTAQARFTCSAVYWGRCGTTTVMRSSRATNTGSANLR